MPDRPARTERPAQLQFSESVSIGSREFEALKLPQAIAIIYQALNEVRHCVRLVKDHAVTDGDATITVIVNQKMRPRRVNE